jgi:CRISPR-associated protein Cas2
MLLVCYDISSDHRRTKVAHLLDGYGFRVQKSVFECHLDHRHEIAMRRELDELIDPIYDKLRFYCLCEKDRAQALAWGRGVFNTLPLVWLA